MKRKEAGKKSEQSSAKQEALRDANLEDEKVKNKEEHLICFVNKARNHNQSKHNINLMGSSAVVAQ